jgi:hypothetical protein
LDGLSPQLCFGSSFHVHSGRCGLCEIDTDESLPEAIKTEF